MQAMLSWLCEYWFEVLTLVFAVTSLVIAVVGAIIASGSKKAAVTSAGAAERSANAAEDSAKTAAEAQLLNKAEHHRRRTPRFDVQLEWLDEQADIPYVRIEYADGEDLETVEIVVEPAQGVRQLFYAVAAAQTEARFRKGDVRYLRVTPPDDNGGRAVIVLTCHTAAGETWTVRKTVDQRPPSEIVSF